MLVAGFDAFHDSTIGPDRDGTDFGGGIEGENIHVNNAGSIQGRTDRAGRKIFQTGIGFSSIRFSQPLAMR